MSETQDPQSAQADAHGAGPFSGYCDEHRPLAGYSVLAGAFGAVFAGALAAATRKRGELPERPDAWDILTAGATTYKLTRIIAKDKVTSFIRAPFVRFEGEAGRGEVSEEPRGEGLRLALGELLVCPYCMGQWVAGTITVGYVTAPRLTRLLTALYAAQALADIAHLSYRAAENALESQ